MLTRRPRPAHPRAFTLVELLVVLAILAILAAVVVPKFTGRTEQARTAAARTDISMIEAALDAFEIDNGRYPTSEEGLQALVEAPAAVAKTWKNPYLKRLPNDPWGNPYHYRSPASHSKAGYDLSSFGPDGREGGGDDIDNWSSQ